MLRTKIGKSSRLFISILVIQDHIESLGKPMLLKGDEVLLNGLLAQVLSDIAPKPSTTFSIQICPNPKLQLGPTDISYPEPPSSYNIGTARNPNSSVSPNTSLGLIEMALPTLCYLVHLFWSHRVMQSVSSRWIDQLVVALLLYFCVAELMQWVPPRCGLP